MVRQKSVPGLMSGVVVLLLLLLIAADGRGESDAPGLSAESSDQIIESENALGFRLLRELTAESESGANVVISPVSIAMALTMTYNGAGGTTSDAMRNVLGLQGLSLEQVNEACRELNGYLENRDPGVTFTSAHALWMESGFPIAPKFCESNERYFGAKVAELDFSSPGAADVINNWVDANTNGKITDILDRVPASAVMYLVNAIYFNGDWKYSFDRGLTQKAPFRLADRSAVMCNMMTTRLLKLPYLDATIRGYQVVELPYGDDAFAATIVLPEPDKNLDELLADLDAAEWKRLTGKIRTASLKVSMPRFTLRSHLELNDALTALGMGVAFSSRETDFSLMSQQGSKDLWISRVIHEAVVEVDEEGTEAAAATVVEMKKGPLPKVLEVNRPFLFVIRDTNSGSIQFLARVSNPTL